jgi:hypothetical protein
VSDAVFIPGDASPTAAPRPADASSPAIERLVATDLARGPWDPGAQHGGAPAALLMRAFERQPGGEELIVARVTYELLRPVPLGALEVSAEVLRPGRRVQLLEGSLCTEDGAKVVRARALRVHRSAVAGGSGASPPDGEEEAPPAAAPPEGARSNDYPAPAGRMFATDAMDIRFTSGAFLELGPASAWFRLRHPLVAGEDPSSLQRLAAAADFGNGISAVLPWDRYLFINPDLTIYVEREPAGEWFLLQARTRLGREGIGLCESLIYDERGRVGRATQALLVTARAT